MCICRHTCSEQCPGALRPHESAGQSGEYPSLEGFVKQYGGKDEPPTVDQIKALQVLRSAVEWRSEGRSIIRKLGWLIKPFLVTAQATTMLYFVPT